MLVDTLLRFVGRWADHLGSVAFVFLLADAMGLLWMHDRPGRRLAVVVGLALIGAVFKLFDKPRRARVESESNNLSS